MHKLVPGVMICYQWHFLTNYFTVHRVQLQYTMLFSISPIMSVAEAACDMMLMSAFPLIFGIENKEAAKNV